MKTGSFPFLFAAVLIVLLWASCTKDDPVGPNDLGGDPNLELTRVGQEFPLSISSTGGSSSALYNLKDSSVSTGNDAGVVTARAVFTFDTAFVRALETELGIEAVPAEIKHAFFETYLQRFGATIDSTNKDAMFVRADVKLKVTSEGIQEFVSSRGDLSRPFTIVKYNANVGDTYTFTNSEGVNVTRTVAYKSETDDYAVGFWYLKVIKVEETKEDPLMEKITYVTNHKFGLVGVHMLTKAGKELRITVFPPTL